mmetsp:Transcript_28500/g.51536  ORF Transcript_28500/g.51536 Transcript_28500/m.51536 type:complete len:221 (+) Transcript_28500:94-756(+)
MFRFAQCCDGGEQKSSGLTIIHSVPASDGSWTEEEVNRPAQEESRARNKTFQITLAKSRGQLGAEIDVASDIKVCSIVAVGPAGALCDWNATCPVGETLEEFDRIVDVDGIPGSSQELVQKVMAARNDETLTLTIEKPMIKEVRVKRDAAPLGLTLTMSDQHQVIVQEVGKGVIQAIADIRTHDKIIAVNGKRLPGLLLVDKLQQKEFTMQVVCYNLDAS